MTIGEARIYATELFVEQVNAALSAAAPITEAEAKALVPVIREQHAALMQRVAAIVARHGATLH